MAEGYLAHKVGEFMDVCSAGAKPSGYVHPVAIEVMAEIGIDISDHRSKHLDEFLKGEVETVITVCDNAETCCPPFLGEVNHFCWPFSDPADAVGSDAEVKQAFRRVRDEIVKTFDEYAQQLMLDAAR